MKIQRGKIPEDSFSKTINDDQITYSSEMQNKKLLRVYVENIPDYSHENITMETVEMAIKDWNDLNPNLEFQRVLEKHNSNVKIKWVTIINGFLDSVGITNSEYMKYGDG